MLTLRFTRGVVFAVILLAALSSKSSADTKDANAKADAAAAARPASRYQLPDGGVKELLAFVKDIQAFKPVTDEEIKERRQKAYSSVETALEKIHDIATEEDKKLPGFEDAMALRLRFRTIIFREGRFAGSPDEKSALIDEIRLALKSSPTPPADAVTAAGQVASALVRSGSSEAARDLYREFGDLLATSPDQQTSKIGVRMQGAARRMALVGQPLELSGTLVDGSKFDWTKYRGKVVLVDFWATWCGPCLRELPNVKKNYERYHDRGFDVVGISLDDDREALDKFLATSETPWATLHDGRREDNAVALQYGILGIPAALLVDKDGKVVSLDARGPKLDLLLAELLGPAGDVEPPPKKSP